MNPSPADRPPPPKRTGTNPSTAKPPAARPAPSKPAPANAGGVPAGPEDAAPLFVTDAASPKKAEKKTPPSSSGTKSKAKKGAKSPWPMIAGSAGGAIIGAIVLVILMNAFKKPPEQPRPRVTKQIKRQALPPREVKPVEK